MDLLIVPDAAGVTKMQRFDVFLDENRLRYLRRYVKDTSRLKTGVSTVIRQAIDDLLVAQYPDYKPVSTDGRGRRKQVTGV